MTQALTTALTTLFAYGPVLFGICFLAPVIAQGMTALGVAPPFGLSPIVFGLIIGTGLGTAAKLRGRWI